MPQAAPLDPPRMTPLAPSVEKAYYRKCIQLKRRLTEVEAANVETKLRRLRLDRAIMKMRLERAFLLDELRKRMDQDVDGSDGSGDEGMATPPPDRPHRDKRRRPQTSQPPAGAAPPTNSLQTAAHTPSVQRTASDPNAGTPLVPGPGGNMVPANAVAEDGNPAHGDAAQLAAQGQTPSQPPALPHGSPYAPLSTGMPSDSATNGMDIDTSNERAERPISREVGATGAPVGAGPATVEENGERRVLSDDLTADPQDGGRGAFTAVN